MGKRVLLILAAIVAVIAIFFALTAQAGTVNFKFDYDFSVDPSCSPTVPTSCVDHFEVWDGTVGTGTLVGSVPAPPGQTVLNTGITGAFTVKGYGAHTLNVIAVAKDTLGVVGVQSAPASVSVSVKPNPPKNVSAQ